MDWFFLGRGELAVAVLGQSTWSLGTDLVTEDAFMIAVILVLCSAHASY